MTRLVTYFSVILQQYSSKLNANLDQRNTVVIIIVKTIFSDDVLVHECIEQDLNYSYNFNFYSTKIPMVLRRFTNYKCKLSTTVFVSSDANIKLRSCAAYKPGISSSHIGTKYSQIQHLS